MDVLGKLEIRAEKEMGRKAVNEIESKEEREGKIKMGKEVTMWKYTEKKMSNQREGKVEAGVKIKLLKRIRRETEGGSEEDK